MLMLQTALQFHQTGEWSQAEALYRQIIATQPEQLDAWRLLGLGLYQQQRFGEAVAALTQAVQLGEQIRQQQDSAEVSRAVATFYRSLGMAQQRNGDIAQAEQSFRQAIELQPALDDSLDEKAVSGVLKNYLSLGNLLLQQQRWADGRATLARALSHVREQQPTEGTFVELYNNLGIACQALADFSQAIDYFQRAARLRPHDPALLFNLGQAHQRCAPTQGRDHLALAEAAYRQAIAQRPDYGKAYLNLGVLLTEVGSGDEALACLRRVIELEPSNSEAYYNWGNLCQAQQRLAVAEQQYQQAVRHQPDFAEAYHNLGVVLAAQDKLVAAEAAYQQALHFAPENRLWQFERLTLIPTVMPDVTAIDRWRTEFEAAVRQQSPLDLSVWLTDLPKSNLNFPFYAAYHGRDNRALKEMYAELFAVSNDLSGGESLTTLSHSEAKIGFVVTQRHEGIFNKLVTGLLNQWQEPTLTPVVVCPEVSLPEIAPHLSNQRVKILSLPSDMATAIAKIRAARFAALYFWEVGTDALNYTLPLFRLAPVQCTSWGIPETTGLSVIDYYLSSEWLEPSAAETQYSEQLVRLPSLPVYYERPALPTTLKTRASLGLPDNAAANLYLCPQSLFKLHPEFDGLLAEILRRDPMGRLVLVEGMLPHWRALLQQRFANSMSDVQARIIWLPRLERHDFLNLMHVCEVMLDPLHYGGTNTTYEGLAVGIPIVTWPSPYLKGRITAGCYRRMGVLDCIAETHEAYIELAVKLGTDADYRATVQQTIQAAAHVLFADTDAVRDLERFFKDVVGGRR